MVRSAGRYHPRADGGPSLSLGTSTVRSSDSAWCTRSSYSPSGQVPASGQGISGSGSPWVWLMSNTDTSLNPMRFCLSGSTLSRAVIGAKILMPVSPFCTWRPIPCHWRKPATCVESGRCM